MAVKTREKLLELVCESINHDCSGHCNLSSPESCFQCTTIVDHLIKNGVIIEKVSRWKLNKNGSGTCERCHFTQKNVWDLDSWQKYCGVCGAEMRDAYS